MKVDWTFLRMVALYAALLAAVIVYPLSSLVSDESLRSVIAAGVLSLFHVLSGYFTVEASYEKRNTTFLKIVLGGMVVRLLLMAGIVFLLLKVYQYDAFSLTMSLLAMYVFNLILEIYLLQRKVSLKQPH